MARLVLFSLALILASGYAEPAHKTLPQKQVDTVFLKQQLDLMTLFYHVHEPNHVPEQAQISHTWSIEKNIDHFSNVTAVKIFVEMYEYGLLPRGMPFSFTEWTHKYLAETLFNVLYSAKDYETFFKTAVWARDHCNEGLFIYALSVAILHRHDTQGIVIPPIYEVFPSYFHNGEIMTTAQRINTHGSKWIEHFPQTYTWNNNVVIKANWTYWPYQINHEMYLAYFTHDHCLNAWYYNWHLTYPSWLGGEVTPLYKDKRGEQFWFAHKQLLARYYMERLSNGLGEIPELSMHAPVEHGYMTGLVHQNGIPFPVRDNHFHFNHHHFTQYVEKIYDFERRIFDAIDHGYIVNSVGEHINIRTPEAIDILGRVIEANVDSPNHNFYGDFISIWKAILGNSFVHKHDDARYNKFIPLVLPSTLEHHHTALRDHAFYMIWKRVMTMFWSWQQYLPIYKREELALPSVNIKDVEVDKMVTYFENTYINVTNHLHMSEQEAQLVEDHVSVLVQHPRLNHKVFQVRVKVNSEAAKTVVVRFFLAPKYDSFGKEIPLHKNTENFFLLDEFTHDLPQGESVIRRDSTESTLCSDEWFSGHDFYSKVQSALNGQGQIHLDQTKRFDAFPERLLLPKGRVNGMPFVFVVYVSEYRAPKVKFGEGFDPALSLGLGSGARRHIDASLGFPFNKPVFDWQVKDLHNFWMEDVLIYHKHTPEVYVAHHE